MKFCPSLHTGRRVEHHHTSYLALGILFVMVGFALGASTLSAAASSQTDQGMMTISATIAGTTPDTAPTILTPSAGQTFAINPIVVSGDCTAGLLVEVRKNGFLAGSGRCANNGSYTVKIDLLMGSNRLTARQYNSIGSSPEATPVTVNFRPTPIPAQTPQSQLIIQSDISAQSSSRGEELSWSIRLLGGSGPYAVTWDWGDGSADLKSAATAGSYTFRHSYSQVGPHAVHIAATDRDGQKAILELSEYTPGDTSASGSTQPSDRSGILLALWPLYILIVLLTWVFYIGERYGEIHERRHPHLSH